MYVIKTVQVCVNFNFVEYNPTYFLPATKEKLQDYHPHFLVLKWYDMVYDMIWYDIFVNCNWDHTRLQSHSTHLHADNA